MLARRTTVAQAAVPSALRNSVTDDQLVECKLMCRFQTVVQVYLSFSANLCVAEIRKSLFFHNVRCKLMCRPTGTAGHAEHRHCTLRADVGPAARGEAEYVSAPILRSSSHFHPASVWDLLPCHRQHGSCGAAAGFFSVPN